MNFVQLAIRARDKSEEMDVILREARIELKKHVKELEDGERDGVVSAMKELMSLLETCSDRMLFYRERERECMFCPLEEGL